MKSIVLSLTILLSSHLLFAQETNSKWKYFEKYSNDGRKKDLLYKHWRQYFLEDIYGELTETPEEEYFCLFYDSYGGLYPDFEYLNQLEESVFDDLTGKELNDKNNLKYSIYQLAINYRYYKTQIKFKQQAKSRLPLGQLWEHEKYKEAINSIPYNNPNNTTISDFYTIWDSLTIPSLSKKLAKKLENKKNVVFFAHGYNVPYSLACLQAKLLSESLDKENIKESETIMIPILWSSNDQKYLNLENSDDFTTKNEKNLKNGTRFWFYSNRAYYAALKFRQLLNYLEADLKDKNVLFLSHSLGTIIPTTAFINNKGKMQQSGISNDLIRLMENTEIPNLRCKVFMSAPAMPGRTTFAKNDMDANKLKNIKYYSTVNKNDEMLGKTMLKKFGLSGKIRANTLNATSLGLNEQGDAEDVKSNFKEIGLESNFIFKEVSNQIDHDIFSYIQQAGYVEFLKEFVEATNN